MSDHLKTLMTPQEVCKRLNIKMSRLRSAIFKKEIPVIRINRLLRFDPEKIDLWLKTNESITIIEGDKPCRLN